jgi:hypothetical protein
MTPSLLDLIAIAWLSILLSCLLALWVIGFVKDLAFRLATIALLLVGVTLWALIHLITTTFQAQ